MTGPRSFTLAALLALGAATAAPARAQTQGPQTQAQIVQTPTGIGPRLWEASVGMRTAFIKDRAFDPFSSNDAFAQFSLSGTRVIARGDRVAFAAGLVLDLGGSGATARGEPSDLFLTRLSALAEGRYQPSARLYGFVRVAPGLLHGSASLTDASSPAGSSLSTTFNAFSVDASAGAALRLGSLGDSRLCAWLVGDGGYGWVQSERLRLAPSLGADQSKAGTLDLGSLTPSGAFFRVSLALAY
jgi:hypothetical protein